ncbi:MAG: glycoside hydrolase family 38 C-terminal domain-containing protein [Clostridia bacterium]|nr:glycoside hydrolase family 38 C-terminal domain-containing protein [Clostridia bacterium]
MAHVKVIRRSLLPDEWTRIRIGWLRKRLISRRAEITGWTVREGHQTGENTYEMYDARPRPLKRGGAYFTPDGTAFLHAEAFVPDDMRDADELRLMIPTAGEMLVRVNGRLQGGIDPNRETMILPASADGHYVIDIEGYNRSKPDDDRNEETTRFKGCRQIFQGGWLVTLDRDAAELYSDVSLFYDLLNGKEFDEDYCEKVSDRLYHALSLIDWDSGAGMKEARAYIARELYDDQLYRGAGKVALVAHSHLDIAYYWRRIHAVQKNARTCLIQLEMMDRVPFLRYTHTQAYLFETLEEYYPELFERVREKVKNGQFEPVGAMYVESDCNIPSPESLARQFMYGQRYFREKFGKICNNCWLPDVFGTSAVLPQILKKSGVDYYVSNKMSTWNDTNRFPHNSFIWRGLDGTEVYACVPPTHFITAATPTEIMQNWNAYQDKDSGAATLCMYGYGDGGSGVTEGMIRSVERLGKISAMPEIRITGAEEYLKENLNETKRLAIWDGELYLEMHRGTYTTKADLKRGNRQLEILLRDAEMAESLRWLAGGEYRAERLEKAWKKLLINQFHDILPGSHIRPVFEDAMADYAAIRAECEDLLGQPAGDALYNTLSFERTMPVFVPDDNGPEKHLGTAGRYVTGEMHALSPVKITEPAGDTGWITVNGKADGTIAVTTSLITAVLAPDGSITSLKDGTDREYVSGAFNTLRLFRDIPGNYDAWDILPTYREVTLPVETETPLHEVRRDGETAVFECVLKTGKSVFRRSLRFFRETGAIETEYDVSWHEDHVLAKAEFECAVRAPYALTDTGAGFITRETNRNTTWQQARYEVCQHLWCDLSETGGGIAIINDGKYGVGIWDNMISLSLLRATCRPDLISDRGEHRFAYLIVPHAGSAVQAEINRMAISYNTPLLRAALPAVKLPETGTMVLQAMKRSEDGERLILRLTEQDGCRGTMRFPFRVTVMNLLEDEETVTDTISYGPFEIITVAAAREDAVKLTGQA